jgi:hypothetical protein
LTSLKQQYFIIHRTNDPEVLIYGKEGPRLYQTQRNAERFAKRWNGWDQEYRDWPNPNEHILKMVAEADRFGPWRVSKITMTLEEL